MQNVLLNKLPKSFTSQFPQGVQIAYAIIPTISRLPEPLKSQVRAAFALATRLIWQVMIGISGAGFLSVLLMRELKLREERDAQWGLQDEKDKEKEVGVTSVPPGELRSTNCLRGLRPTSLHHCQHESTTIEPPCASYCY